MAKQFVPHQNYTSKRIEIPVLDLTTLLYNIYEGSKEKNIGWEDAALTLNDITRNLTYTCHVQPDDVESALWSCNLRDENKKFWDIKGRTFDEYLKSVVPGYKFNKDYNFITKKEGRRDV
jgi:hypothetical protein